MLLMMIYSQKEKEMWEMAYGDTYAVDVFCDTVSSLFGNNVSV